MFNWEKLVSSWRNKWYFLIKTAVKTISKALLRIKWHRVQSEMCKAPLQWQVEGEAQSSTECWPRTRFQVSFPDQSLIWSRMWNAGIRNCCLQWQHGSMMRQLLTSMQFWRGRMWKNVHCPLQHMIWCFFLSTQIIPASSTSTESHKVIGVLNVMDPLRL